MLSEFSRLDALSRDAAAGGSRILPLDRFFSSLANGAMRASFGCHASLLSSAALLLPLLGCQPRSADTATRDSAAGAEASLQPPSDEAARSLEPGAASESPAGELVAAAELTWVFEATRFGRIDVVIRVPERRQGVKLPALIAFHGRGETLKGSKRGARGWLDDYHLERTIERLSAPPLERRDFRGFVTAERLKQLNEELEQRPFRDLVLVMPYLPDVLKREELFEKGPMLADFVVGELLPRIERELPVRGDARSLGIDGVSLGGRAALMIGLSNAASFGTLGATQAAVDENEIERLVQLAVRAHATNSELKLRVLTSEEDYYRSVLGTFASKLSERGVPHRFDVVSGNHSYEFNQGPGGIEMLLFHSRELARH